MSHGQQFLSRLPRNVSSNGLTSAQADNVNAGSRPTHEDGSEARIKVYHPLPLDLFPRPDPEKEIEESGRSSCFRFYDLEKYSIEEATRLASMDIIPKDAVVTVWNKQDIRAMRTTRGKSSRYEPAAKKSKVSLSSPKILAIGSPTAMVMEEQNEVEKKRKSESADFLDGIRKRGRPRKNPMVSSANESNVTGQPIVSHCPPQWSGSIDRKSSDVKFTVKSSGLGDNFGKITFVRNRRHYMSETTNSLETPNSFVAQQ